MEFIYKVKDVGGKTYLGVSEAEDVRILKQNLRERGWYALKISPFKEKKRGILFRRRVDINLLIMFTHELASILDAGIPILNGLDIMWKQIDDPTFQIVISQIRNRLSQGRSISEAFNEFPDIFPPIYRSLLGVAETSGNLVKALRKLLEYLIIRKEFIVKIKKITTYPLIVVCFSLFVVLLMLLWVVPIFNSVFIKLKIQLPLFTRLVMGISSVMRTGGFWLFIALLFLTLFFVYRKFRSYFFGREAIDRFKLKVPILGRIIYDASVAQFCRSLSLLLDGGLPITLSMEMAKSTVMNTKILKALNSAQAKVVEGATLAASLSESGVFPQFLVEMISVGEESGTLVEMLDKIGLHFEEELDYRLNKFLTFLEPLLIIVVGGLVVFILLSIYLPIFKLWGGIANIR
ncbi:MAG: type II secretion system F family protein [Candidatus Omnitrophica bacterium]|nr:type II secretion system F family protein [Candidatus Omnitrophota bacterium]